MLNVGNLYCSVMDWIN